MSTTVSLLPDDRTQRLIAAIWQRNQPVVVERLAHLDQAAAAAIDGTLTAEQLEGANSIAHKLAGSLGMFGLHEGSRIALALEKDLDRAGSIDTEAVAERVLQLRQSIFPAAE